MLTRRPTNVACYRVLGADLVGTDSTAGMAVNCMQFKDKDALVVTLLKVRFQAFYTRILSVLVPYAISVHALRMYPDRCMQFKDKDALVVMLLKVTAFARHVMAVLVLLVVMAVAVVHGFCMLHQVIRCAPSAATYHDHRRWQEAGAVIYAKTNVPQSLMLPESTNAIFGPALNPYNLARTPGGSSGGRVESPLYSFTCSHDPSSTMPFYCYA
jgi:hypothetical protein